MSNISSGSLINFAHHFQKNNPVSVKPNPLFAGDNEARHNQADRFERTSNPSSSRTIDLSHRDSKGNTPLALAVNDPELVQSLLAQGADPELANRYGNTPLMLAAKGGHLESAKLLVEALKARGTDFTTVTNKMRNTALHLAAEAGHTQVAVYLTQQGFNPRLFNLEKYSPIALAERYEHTSTASALKQEALSIPENPEVDDPISRLFTDARSTIRYHQGELPINQIRRSTTAQAVTPHVAQPQSAPEDDLSPGQRIIAHFMNGKSLLSLEPAQAHAIMSDNDALEELTMNLVADAAASDQQKVQIEKGLCYQFFNSSGAVNKFWHRVTHKAFEKSPQDLAKDYPDTQKLLAITHPPKQSNGTRGPQKTGFGNVAGMDKLKQKLKNQIITPWIDNEDDDVIVEKTNGCLLFGPSRTGKSHIATEMAHEMGYSDDDIIYVNASDLIEPDQGKSMQNIGRLFNDAKSRPNGAVIIMDEVDALTPKRKDVQTHHAEMPQIVSQLGLEMQEVGQQGVFVIGTTNHPNVMDNALRQPGRFDHQFPVGLPDKEARKALFQHLIDARFLKQSPITGDQLDELAEKSKDFSAGDIQQNIRSAINQWRSNKKDKPYWDYLSRTVTKYTPQNDQEELDAFKEYIQAKGLNHVLDS